jgi:hypothetical protein
MNLNNIVSKALTSVHPLEEIELYICKGQTTNENGRITPAYESAVILKAQIQTASETALRFEGMSGVSAYQLEVWIDGSAKGIDRITETGGDMIHARGRWWKVTAIPGNFANVGWVCFRITMQLNAPEGIVNFYDSDDVYGVENVYL